MSVWRTNDLPTRSIQNLCVNNGRFLVVKAVLGNEEILMNPVNDNTAIEMLLQQITQAHAEKNADKLASLYDSTALLFDLAPPLAHHGMNSSETADWFDTWDGAIQLAHTDVNIEISGELAVVTALAQMRGKKKQGEQVTLWFRITSCLKKRNGRWIIFHEHTSVPFYMDGSDRAALDLQP